MYSLSPHSGFKRVPGDLDLERLAGLDRARRAAGECDLRGEESLLLDPEDERDRGELDRERRATFALHSFNKASIVLMYSEFALDGESGAGKVASSASGSGGNAASCLHAIMIA